MNENYDEDFERAAAVAEVERAALAPKTRERYRSSNYQYILWLMQYIPHLVHPELVAEVEEMTMSPILTPSEKKVNIHDRIKKVWLGETYNGMIDLVFLFPTLQFYHQCLRVTLHVQPMQVAKIA